MNHVAVGEVMRGSGLGQMTASISPRLAVDDWMYGVTGWRHYVVAKVGGIFGVNQAPDGVDPTAMLSGFSVSDVTAYFGMTEVAKPADGSAAFVSAAASTVCARA